MTLFISGEPHEVRGDQTLRVFTGMSVRAGYVQTAARPEC
jgi:hypothetical protein